MAIISPQRRVAVFLRRRGTRLRSLTGKTRQGCWHGCGFESRRSLLPAKNMALRADGRGAYREADLVRGSRFDPCRCRHKAAGPYAFRVK